MKWSSSMMDTNLVGRCGIYCGACYVFRAFKDRGEFLDILSEKLGVPKEEIRCSGCSGPDADLWRNCRRCKIAACLGKKGCKYCYECPQFESPCDEYERIRKFCSERGEDIRESLRRIKAGEVERWLKEQDEKWRCGTCGGPISWYEEKCHHCRHTL